MAQKTTQLKALQARYRERRAEAVDAAAALQAEREDLLADYRSLSQQVKLKSLVIASFIPPDCQELIMGLCSWNEQEQAWAIANVHASGQRAARGSCGRAMVTAAADDNRCSLCHPHRQQHARTAAAGPIARARHV